MSKIKIEYKKRESLIPYANNSRTHSEGQVKQIAASIKEFGFTNPILIDEKSGIIAGHGRLQAAEVLNLDEVPTITLKGLTDAQRRAYVIADNKLALNAGWDEELLGLELINLDGEGFNLDVMGFEEKELQKLFLDSIDEIEEINNVFDENEFLVIIECKNELEQEQVFKIAQEKEWSCKLMN